MLVIHPWGSLLLNIDPHWLVFITHVTWMRPLLQPWHIVNSEIVWRNYLAFKIINKEEKKNNRKLRKSDAVHFLSHHTHRFFLGQRCVKWSVKWVHLTSLQWIIHIILHGGSRASRLSSGNLSSVQLCSSHSHVHWSSCGQATCAMSTRCVWNNVFRSFSVFPWNYLEHHTGVASLVSDKMSGIKNYPNRC